MMISDLSNRQDCGHDRDWTCDLSRFRVFQAKQSQSFWRFVQILSVSNPRLERSSRAKVHVERIVLGRRDVEDRKGKAENGRRRPPDYLTVFNDGDTAVENLVLSMESDPSFFEP